VTRIGWSVAASFASKVTSLIQQAATVPLAIALLGTAAFAQYSLITAAFGWVGFSTLGVTPSLTRRLAESAAHGDVRQERHYFVTTMVASSISVMLLAAAILAAYLGGLTAPVHVFGSSADVRMALVLAGGFSLCTVATAGFDAALLGYQAQYVTSALTFLSSLLSVAILLVAAFTGPTISMFIIALMAPPLVARLGSGAVLLRIRPYLRVGPRWFRWRLLPTLISDGISFSVISLASYATQQFTLLLLGATLNGAQIAAAAVMLRLSNILGSVVVVVTTPLWPALVDSTTLGDRQWATGAYKHLTVGATCFAVAAGLLVAIGGPGLLHVWIGTNVHLDTVLTSLFLPYFLLGIWSHVHAMVGVGLGAMSQVAAVLGIEAVVALLILVHLPAAPANLLLAPATASVLVSSWLLPYIVHMRLSSPRDRQLS
jgi:O-antigen/teichoic acid export membrane protein